MFDHPSYLASVILLSPLTIYVLSKLFPPPSPDSSSKVSTLIVLGSGGHTSEILSLTSSLSANKYEFTYALAETDKTSEGRVRAVSGRGSYNERYGRKKSFVGEF